MTIFSLQYRFPKGIYSLEIALWLHGLSLTIPFEPVMTFSFGTNTRPMKEAGVKPIVARKYHEIGIIRLERQAGQFISVYDMERTLVECLRTAYHVDIQVIAPAFQAYFKKGAVDYAKLYHYAQLFKSNRKTTIICGGLVVKFSNANSFKAKIKNIAKEKGISFSKD